MKREIPGRKTPRGHTPRAKGKNPAKSTARMTPPAKKKSNLLWVYIGSAAALLLVVIIVAIVSSGPSTSPARDPGPAVGKSPAPVAKTPKKDRTILVASTGTTVGVYSEKQLLDLHIGKNVVPKTQVPTLTDVTLHRRFKTVMGLWVEVKTKAGEQGWVTSRDLRAPKDPASMDLPDETDTFGFKLAAHRAPTTVEPEPAPKPEPEPAVAKTPEPAPVVAPKPAPKPTPARTARAIPLVDGAFELTAERATLHGKKIRIDRKYALLSVGFWNNKADFLEWRIAADAEAEFDAVLTYSCGQTGGDFAVEIAGNSLQGKASNTGGWGSFRTVNLGSIRVPKGSHAVTMKRRTGKGGLMNLAVLKLVPPGSAPVAKAEPAPSATNKTIIIPPGVDPRSILPTTTTSEKASGHFVLLGQFGMTTAAAPFLAGANEMYELWKEKLGAAGEIPDTLKVNVHFRRDEYSKAAPGGTRYHVDGDTLHLMYGKAMFKDLAEGGTRLYLSQAYPGLSKREDLPPWVTAGVVSYFGAAESKEGKVTLDSLELPLSSQSVLEFQQATKSSAWKSFSKGFKLTGRDYIVSRRIVDIQAWATCYYLFNAPGKSGGKGKGAGEVRSFLAALDGGAAPPAALEELCKKSVGATVNTLESKVKSYLKAVDLMVADREEGDWLVGETAHYTIFVEKGARNVKTRATDRMILQELKFKMELLFEKYAMAFRYEGRLPQKAILRLYKDKGSYMASGASPTSAAYYSPSKKELVGYEDSAETGIVFNILCHEGCHQFFDLAFPGFYQSEDIPMWFSEGLADCFGASAIRGKDLYIFTLSGVAGWRVPRVKSALTEGPFTSLRNLLKMGRFPFMAQGGLHYAQSWSFVHFLWNAPTLDSGKGRYREVVIKLIDGFKQGKKRDEVYKEAFQINGKPLDLDVLEREWKAYVKKLRVRK